MTWILCGRLFTLSSLKGHYSRGILGSCKPWLSLLIQSGTEWTFLQFRSTYSQILLNSFCVCRLGLATPSKTFFSDLLLICRAIKHSSSRCSYYGISSIQNNRWQKKGVLSICRERCDKTSPSAVGVRTRNTRKWNWWTRLLEEIYLFCFHSTFCSLCAAVFQMKDTLMNYQVLLPAIVLVVSN